VAWFRRGDHIGDLSIGLDEFIRQTVHDSGRGRPDGKIFILTNLRYFGFVFNPVSFYFCFDKSDQLQTMVAEVTNTPWGQTHCYVVDRQQLMDAAEVEQQLDNGGSDQVGDGSTIPLGTVQMDVETQRNGHLKADQTQVSIADGSKVSVDAMLTKKVLHVSPFMSMDYAYQWFLRITDDHLTLHMENIPDSKEKSVVSGENQQNTAQVLETDAVKVANAVKNARPLAQFNVTLSLAKQKMNGWNRGSVLILYPLITVRILLAIYWQALRLWWLAVPFVPHPEKTDATS